MNEEIKTNLTKEELKEKLKSERVDSLSDKEKELLKQFTSFLSNDISLVERKYYLVNDLNEVQKCPVCGIILPYLKNKNRLAMFCSKECQRSEKGILVSLEKRKKTNIKKYGEDNPMKNNGIKNKQKQTCAEKFGCENVSSNIFIKEKKIITTLRHYGVENPLQSLNIKEKIRQTNIKKYGVENPQQSGVIRNKTIETNIKKYGVENSGNAIENKIKSTISKRKSLYDKFISKLNEKDIECLSEKEEYYAAGRGSVLKFKCHRCNKIFNYRIGKNGISYIRVFCPNHSHNQSGGEEEIYYWLLSLGIKNIERNKRNWNREKVFESDIFLPDYNLAIEYNGLYWHSDAKKKNDYHYNKWKFFKDMNIDCIQIFENEWILKKDIVKNIILKRLIGTTNKIKKDDFCIEELSDSDSVSFVSENSIFPFIKSMKNFGIFHNNTLRLLISINKLNEKVCGITNIVINNDTDGEAELSFILKRLSSEYESILLYNNIRINDNATFYKLGFKFKYHTAPNIYFYKYNELDFVNNNYYIALSEIMNEYHSNILSTKELFSENKFLCIYDCGFDLLQLDF